MIEFELRGPGPRSRTCAVLLNLVIFVTKTKISKANNTGMITSKNIAGGNMYLAPFMWTKALTKFTPKFKLLNMFWS